MDPGHQFGVGYSSDPGVFQALGLPSVSAAFRRTRTLYLGGGRPQENTLPAQLIVFSFFFFEELVSSTSQFCNLWRPLVVATSFGWSPLTVARQ